MTETSESREPTGARTTVMRRAGGFVRREAPWFLSLVTVSALAIAQPILTTLSTDATIFEGRASSKVAIVSFALIVTLAPATALWCIELVARRISDRLRQRLHVIFLAGLGWAFFIQLLKNIDALAPRIVTLLALLAAVGLAALYVRFGAVRRWLAIMSPLALYLLVSFLFLSPAWSFLRAGGAPTASAAEGTVTDTPMVVVVFDELGTSALLDGDGSIDPDLLPNLHRLSEDSTWYRNATTVGPHTPLALPAILTGQYPSDDLAEAATSSSYDGSLFSLLADTHELNVHEPFTRFCTTAIGCTPHPTTTTSDELSTLLDLGQVVWEGAIDPGRSADIPLNVAARDDGDPAGYFDAFVESISPSGDQPTLDFVHVLLPHAPYRRLPSGATYNAPAIPDGGQSWQGPWSDDDYTWAARQRHLLQAQYADAQLGLLLDELEASGRYDESLIVVTADHGSAFVTDEPSRSLTEANAPHVAWVPLLVKAPDQTTPVVDDVPIENVDVLPLIADTLGVDIPWDVDGRPAGDRADDEHAQLVPWRADGEPWADNVLEPTGDRTRVELDREVGFAAMLATETVGRPGTDARWRPYQRGPYAALLGRDIDGLRVDERTVEGQVTTGTRVVFAPGRAPSPVYVAGDLGGRDRAEVAIVIDGVVVALLPTHPDDGNTFAGLVPEDMLAVGDNRVEAYLVDGPPDAPVLRPVGS